MSSLSLNKVPQEVLEHIAFFAATDVFPGPPAGLLPLLTVNRRIHSYLSIASNHHLYARIFQDKFDIVAPNRRLDGISSAVIAKELQRRCLSLKRFRAKMDWTMSSIAIRGDEENTVRSVLWIAYLMMLENDGKNEQQLRLYAQLDEWLKDYWFHAQGASLVVRSINANQWPPNNEQNALAMWLFWFLLKPGEVPKGFLTFCRTYSHPRRV